MRTLRGVLTITVVLVATGVMPTACDEDERRESETLQSAIERVNTEGLRPEEAELSAAIESGLEPWEVTYLTSLDWSALTPEGVAADPVFRRLFAISDEVQKHARASEWWGRSIAYASCELGDAAARCVSRLVRGGFIGFPAGALAVSCGTLAPAIPGGAPTCVALAVGLIVVAVSNVPECTQALGAAYSCAIDDVAADDYFDPAEACRAQGRQLCPNARACYGAAQECPGAQADAGPMDGGPEDGGVDADAGAGDGSMSDGAVSPEPCGGGPACEDGLLCLTYSVPACRGPICPGGGSACICMIGATCCNGWMCGFNGVGQEYGRRYTDVNGGAYGECEYCAP